MSKTNYKFVANHESYGITVPEITGVVLQESTDMYPDNWKDSAYICFEYNRLVDNYEPRIQILCAENPIVDNSFVEAIYLLNIIARKHSFPIELGNKEARFNFDLELEVKNEQLLDLNAD